MSMCVPTQALNRRNFKFKGKDLILHKEPGILSLPQKCKKKFQRKFQIYLEPATLKLKRKSIIGHFFFNKFHQSNILRIFV